MTDYLLNFPFLFYSVLTVFSFYFKKKICMLVREEYFKDIMKNSARLQLIFQSSDSHSDLYGLPVVSRIIQNGLGKRKLIWNSSATFAYY